MRLFASSVMCGCLCLVSWCAATTAYADSYEVDPVHSSVVFRVKHSNINYVYGLFAQVGGSFTVDGTGEIEVYAVVESINTGNEGRDTHLKGPDYFNGKQFPRVVFRSTEVKRLDEHAFEVAGEVSMRGVTHPVVARLTTTTGQGRGGQPRGGVEGALKIKRSDFQLGGPGGLGNEVDIMVSLQGVKK